MGEGVGGKIWENGNETCKISCRKRVANPGSMHDVSNYNPHHACRYIVYTYPCPKSFLLFPAPDSLLCEKHRSL